MYQDAEQLYYPRKFFTFEPAGSDNQVERRKTNRELALAVRAPTNLPARMSELVGEELVFHAGAPGIGRQVIEITAIDEDGIWGIEKSNTIRVLDPSEVI